MADQQNKSIHYNLLKRDLQRDRELYDAMIRSMKQVGLTNALQASNLRVIDPARPAREPHRPRTALNTLFAFLAGGFLSVITVLLGETSSSKFKQPGDISKYVQVEELAPSRHQVRVFGNVQALRYTVGWFRTPGVSLCGRNALESGMLSAPSELENWGSVESYTAQCFAPL